MPALKPQTRFLLRGSALLIGLLALWWFVLLGPMLYLLQGAATAFVTIQQTPAGDWTLRVPFETTLPATPQQPVAQPVHSIDFDLPRADAIAFTFSLPVFWAIALAAPGLRRSLRPLLLGTLVMCAVELLMLFVFTRITAWSAVSQLAGAEDAAGKWIRHFGEYLIVSVLPYAVPVVVALSLHGGLRAAIFPWAKAAAPQPAAVPQAAGRPARRRFRK